MVPVEPMVIGLALFPTPLAKVELEETSNPEGGVTLIPSVMSAPDTVKLVVVVEAVPYVVLTAAKVPFAVIIGDAGFSTRVPVKVRLPARPPVPLVPSAP